MLYYTFRESLSKAVQSISGVLENGAPDIDEAVPKEVDDFLTDLQNKKQYLSSILEELPSELVDYQDKRFGPVVDHADLHHVLSILLPLAETFNDEFPLLSHFPLELFREKSSLILETMILYCEWKSYFESKVGCKSKMVKFIKSKDLSNEGVKIPTDRLLLPLLFENLKSAAGHAKRDIGNDFGKSFEQI